MFFKFDVISLTLTNFLSFFQQWLKLWIQTQRKLEVDNDFWKRDNKIPKYDMDLAWEHSKFCVKERKLQLSKPISTLWLILNWNLWNSRWSFMPLSSHPSKIRRFHIGINFRFFFDVEPLYPEVNFTCESIFGFE